MVVLWILWEERNKISIEVCSISMANSKQTAWTMVLENVKIGSNCIMLHS